MCVIVHMQTFVPLHLCTIIFIFIFLKCNLELTVPTSWVRADPYFFIEAEAQLSHITKHGSKMPHNIKTVHSETMYCVSVYNYMPVSFDSDQTTADLFPH